MDQKMLLAIMLSMLVMIGFYALFPPQPPQQTPQEATAPIPGAPVEGAAVVGGSAIAPGTLSSRADSPVAGKSDGASAMIINIETPQYLARINTLGGELVSLRLKHYRVSMNQMDWGELIPPLATYLSESNLDPEKRVEMVQRSLPGPGLLGVVFEGNAALTEAFSRTVFAADRDAVMVRDANSSETLTLVGQTPDGLTLRKTLTFQGDGYQIDYAAAVINYGQTSQTLRVQYLFGEGAVPTEDTQAGYSHVGPIYQDADGMEFEDADDLERLLPVRDPEWVGIAEPYFLSAAAADTTIAYAFIQGQPNPLPDGQREWIARYGMELPVVVLDPGKQIESHFRLYLGPKAEAELAKFSESLREALDITLAVLAKPLLVMLRWFHGFTGNWGVAIILLTVVVRVALFPLTYKGMVSMKRMQKLQPKMVALKEKFKNDREKMNREMMGLYKRYKINPLGGCLPILLQLPIFFALYSALGSAIELRHAPFIAWITDLSAMDGLFILPLLMGGSMVIQQRLTPTTMDPTQAKILMWMPVIFTAFMFTFPSGLVLYWFTSNLLSILQQLLINRIKVPELVERTA